MNRRTALLLVVLLALAGAAGCASGPKTSAEGNVKVTLPPAGETVVMIQQTDGSWKGTVHTTGTARAFEATVSWQASFLASSGTTISLGDGAFMTSAGAPEFGSFDQLLTLVEPAGQPEPTGKGTLRIFIASMKDGSPLDIVDIPITVRTGQ
jgi:hypothetical protein